MASIIINDEFRNAFDTMEHSGTDIFLTGKAGTGKSTLLTYFRKNTLKNVAVLAPTGVAALNVRGQTIHSFFGFKPNVTLSKVRKLSEEDPKVLIVQKLDTIIIDEVSMVRADLLDCVDKFLRLNGRDSEQPFGGIQMIFIGDLYQLPPIVSYAEKEYFSTLYPSPYFFDAHVIQQTNLTLLELTTVYRQKDPAFIEILNAIRSSQISRNHLTLLNARFDSTYQLDPEQLSMYLTTTNARAKEVNDEHLSRLSGIPHEVAGTVEGTFEEKDLPTDRTLGLKEGAQVMCIANDPAGNFVNGTVGKVLGWDKEGVQVKLDTGKICVIEKYTWEMFRYSVGKDGGLTTETLGTFRQIPLKLAWAVTIHKSQGKTFERVVIDLERGTFAHGQLYVALSRCTSLEGMVLKTIVKPGHIRLDRAVVEFLEGMKQ